MLHSVSVVKHEQTRLTCADSLRARSPFSPLDIFSDSGSLLDIVVLFFPHQDHPLTFIAFVSHLSYTTSYLRAIFFSGQHLYINAAAILLASICMPPSGPPSHVLWYSRLSILALSSISTVEPSLLCTPHRGCERSRRTESRDLQATGRHTFPVLPVLDASHHLQIAAPLRSFRCLFTGVYRDFLYFRQAYHKSICDARHRWSPMTALNHLHFCTQIPDILVIWSVYPNYECCEHIFMSSRNYE